MEFSNPNNARKINRLRVLNALLEKGSLTRAELSRHLNLNKISVSEIAATLLSEEMILETGKTLATKDGGRPGTILSLNGKKAWVLGIDIGEVAIRIALADLTGAIQRYEKIPFLKGRDIALQIVENLKRMFKSEPREIAAIAVAADGMADDKAGTITFAHGSDSVPYPIRAKLQALGIDCPIPVLSQLTAQVKAERMYFRQSLSGALFINWGEYLSSAFITKTETVENLEFGHIKAASQGLCHCGSIGCIDSIASGWGFKRLAADRLGSALSVKDLLKTEQGDALLREGIESLGKTIALAVTATGANAVILEGGIAAIPDSYLAILYQGLRPSLPSHLERIPVYRGNFRERCTAQGAVFMALDRLYYSRDVLCTLGYLDY